MDTTALSKLTHGLYVLGAKDGDRYVGCIVDAVMQASLKPLAVAVSCMKTGYTQSCIRRTNAFSLSVLGQHVDPFVIGNFGYQSGRTVDKWAAVPFVVKDDLPFYREAVGFLTCHVVAMHEFDSHVVKLRLGDLLRFGADGKLHPLPPVRRQVDGETAARGTLVRLFRGDGAGEFLIVPLVIPVTEELAFFHFDWAPVRLRVRGGGKERDASQKQCNGKCFFHLLTYFCEKSAFPFLENAFSRTSFDGVAGSALRSSTALPEYSTSHIFASRNA